MRALGVVPIARQGLRVIQEVDTYEGLTGRHGFVTVARQLKSSMEVQALSPISMLWNPENFCHL
jgi:hypothetical protein